MVVQHNMTALNANRMLGVVNTQQSKSTEKLASGYKINRAGDNAAGLAISEKMRGQIRGLNQASANAQDGISLIQTAEGALTETHSLIQRMRELAVQAASDTNTDDDRSQIQGEINQLTREVDRIANTTEFNTKKLLDGSVKGATDVKKSTLKLEGDFSNSDLGLKVTNVSNADKLSVTDVIRIEFTKNVTGAFGSNNKLSEAFKLTSLFGKATAAPKAKFAISENKAIVVGSTGHLAKIEISGGDSKIKAGDVITITIGKGQREAEKAPTGKDALRLQIGANAGQELALGISSMKAKDLDIAQQKGDGVGTGLKVTDQKSASLAINAYDLAIQKVSTERSKMGAVQNRLEHTISNLDTSAENLQTAESRIRDTDMAAEMVNFSKNSIIQQAAQSMLAQANQANQGVLSLLR